MFRTGSSPVPAPRATFPEFVPREHQNTHTVLMFSTFGAREGRCFVLKLRHWAGAYQFFELSTMGRHVLNQFNFFSLRHMLPLHFEKVLAGNFISALRDRCAIPRPWCKPQLLDMITVHHQIFQHVHDSRVLILRVLFLFCLCLFFSSLCCWVHETPGKNKFPLGKNKYTREEQVQVHQLITWGPTLPPPPPPPTYYKLCFGEFRD